MSDIVDLLRDAADEIERERRLRTSLTDLMKLRGEEIERLETENEEKGAENLRLMEAGSNLRSKVAQLKAALESLTKDPPATFAREPDTDCEVIIKMRAIARAALEEGE